MPRSSSTSSRPISPSRPHSMYPTQSRSVAPAPTPATAPAPVVIQQPGFFTNVMQGFGLGAGQAIAHNIFRRDPAPPQASPAVHSESTKHNFSKEFVQCMKDNNNNTDVCKQFL